MVTTTIGSTKQTVCTVVTMITAAFFYRVRDAIIKRSNRSSVCHYVKQG